MSATAIAAAVAALPVELPASAETLETCAALAAEVRGLAPTGAREELAAAIATCLEECAAGRVALHEAVPHLVAALEQIDAPEREGWETAMAGARWEIETLLPGPVRPDVSVDALRKKPREE